MKRLLTILIAAVLALVLVMGGRWYIYVTSADQPYDEVGIAITQFMPAPLRAWGCAQLEARFATALPPMGCSGEDGRRWM